MSPFEQRNNAMNSAINNFGTEISAPGTSAPGTSAPGTSAPGTSAPGTSAPVGDVPAPRAEKTFTQAQVNQMMQQRIQKERNRTNAQLSELGFEGGLEGVQSFREQQAQAAAQHAEEQRQQLESGKKYEELLTVERKNHNAAIAAKNAAIATAQQRADALQTQHQNERIRTRVLSAAVGAINPSHVVQLLENRIKPNTEGGGVHVVDEFGVTRHDLHGNPLSVEAYVASFLEQNPNYVRPIAHTAPQTQSGRVPIAGNPSTQQAFDAKRAASDPEYVRNNKEATEAFLRGR